MQEPLVSEAVPQGADRLPTLTEVVEMGLDGVSAESSLPTPPAADAPTPVGDTQPAEAPADEAVATGSTVEPVMPVMPVMPLPVVAPSVDVQALVTQVLAELSPRVDMLFQSRLREAMAPALARAADLLIRDARDELSASMRELVQDAVTRALQRRLDQ